MKGLLLAGLAAFAAIGLWTTSAAATSSPPSETELRAAATRAIALMQQSQVTWRKAQSCSSCHHQLIPEVAIALAANREVPFDSAISGTITKANFAYQGAVDEAIQETDYVDVYFDAWMLVSKHAMGLEPNSITDAYSSFIGSNQAPDGSWLSTDARPPQVFGECASTAYCARAIALYMPESLSAERDARLARARAWLEDARPVTTEDRISRLLGLSWTGAQRGAIARAARELVAEQKADGSWAQLGGRDGEAYSTGYALYALAESKTLKPTDAAYVRGLHYLLSTQQPDGSWRVASRLHPPAPVSPPYFESGFPYGHDQFVSMMGTAWAAIAILESLPPGRSVMVAPYDPPTVPAWLKTAVSGTAAELRALLDGGLDPNAATEKGTTLLMASARNRDKVALLVERGADVNARAASGVTALMVASRYRGNVATVKLLLAHGARPKPEPGVKVTNNASALYYGVIARDPAIVRTLCAAGANPDERMVILGVAPYGSLAFATTAGDAQTVEALIDCGVDANTLDDSGITPLSWAAIYGRTEVARVLIAHGARVNGVDAQGMTPLLYAASIDYGDDRMVRLLVESGARRATVNREGQTALQLARGYGHTRLTRTLGR